MADNYLEKRYAQVFSGEARSVIAHPSLEHLLRKAAPAESLGGDYRVHELQLRSIARAAIYAQPLMSAALEIVPLADDDGLSVLSAAVSASCSLPCCNSREHADDNPAVSLMPLAPSLVICSPDPGGRDIDIDLGIAIQSMLLKAAEMGLRGIVFRKVNNGELGELHLPSTALAVIAFGK